MKSMRFFVVLFAVLMAGMACAQDKSWPWDFPQGVKIEAEPGQKILSCESFYFDDLKKGDKVWATFVDGFRDGYTVKEINEKVGRVWVQRNGNSSMDCKSIAEVTKVFD